MESFESTRLLPWLLRTSWEACILIALVWVIQTVFRKHLAPRWRHALWLLVVIRLLLPYSIPSSLSLFNVARLKHVPVVGNLVYSAPHVAVPSIDSEMPAASEQGAVVPESSRLKDNGLAGSFHLSFRTVPHLIFIAWITGAIVLLGRILQQDSCFAKRVGRTRMVTDSEVLEILDDCRRLLQIRYPVPLLETKEVQTPALYGALHPRLLVPVGMRTELTARELRHVFLHELAHVKRRDMLVHWVMTVAQVLHWFNPLVWMALARMRVEREVACDALVLAYAEKDENQSYGETLLKILERLIPGVPNPSIVGLIEKKGPIRERITMIASFSPGSHFPVLALLFVLGIGFIGLTDARVFPSELPGLVHWWSADGTLADLKGGRNGLAHGNVRFSTGKIGLAFDFNGRDQYIEVPDSSDLNPKGSFSVSLWIFPRSSEEQVLLSKWGDFPEDYNNRSYSLLTQPELGVRFGIADMKNQWNPFLHRCDTKFEVLSLNSWNHLVAVYDASTGTRRIYVDGTVVAEKNTPAIQVLESHVALSFGANVFSSSGMDARQYFNGKIDDIRMYSRVLSAGEVVSLYEAGLAGMNDY